VIDRVDELGLSTKFLVTADRYNSVLHIEAESSSAPLTVETLDSLVRIATDDLSNRQDLFDIDPRERVTTAVAKDSVATVDLGGRLRIRAILLILAIGFAFSIGVLVEGIIAHQAGRPLTSHRYEIGGSTETEVLNSRHEDDSEREPSLLGETARISDPKPQGYAQGEATNSSGEGESRWDRAGSPSLSLRELKLYYGYTHR